MTIAERKRLLRQIISVIKKSKTFFLSGHQKPDGDTVASELAMASLLKRLGKKVDIYNAETVPSMFDFWPAARKIKTAKKVAKQYDAAFIFECFDGDRMGNIIDLKTQAKTVVNIDHHLKHSFFGDINFINPKASSNSEQLYYFFEALKIPILRQEAEYLYLGIMADTGRFMHSNTNAETLRISSKLVERGVQVHFLTEKMYGTQELPALRLLGFCLTNFQFVHGGKIAYAAISEGDFKRTGATSEDTEEIVNYGLRVPGVLISILLKQNKSGDKVKISLRGKRQANVCALAEQFGGGGHQYAAGCQMEGDLNSVISKVLSAAQKSI